MSGVCILGSGNVATHLAIALSKAGYTIKGIYSRHRKNAEALADLVTCPCATDDVAALPDAEMFFISVKDDALPAVATALSKRFPKRLCIHTAGSVPLSVLTPYFKYAAVLYPMQTFNKHLGIDFSAVPLFVEATDAQTLEQIRHIADSLSGQVTVLSSAQRRKLHLSAVFACNFANHCYAIAYSLLRESGIAPQCLRPLIMQTAQKVMQMEPAEAQTGPAIRWDEQVIQRQTELLSSHPDLQDIYKTMSQNIHRTYTYDKLQS